MNDRNIKLLADENRFVRKKALLEIEQNISEHSKCLGDHSLRLEEYATFLSEALNDKVEVNRELVIKVIQQLIERASNSSEVLTALMPVLVKRLGQKEIVETSEELRFQTLKLLKYVLEKDFDITPFVDDLVLVLQHCLLDSFHEIKKLCCSLVQDIARRKIHRFFQISESLLTPLLGNITHQHSKVRASTILAIEALVMYGQGKMVDQVLSPITQRLFDDASTVRRSVIDMVGSWLLDLPDRYSYHTKLLPIILSGLTDDSNEIKCVTEDFWHDIGLKFEKENEEQLKDKLDFDKGYPDRYPLGCRRPTAGARELVYRSASRLLPALCRDLGDWQASTRSKAAGLIPILMMHLEQATTQHTQHLLTGLGAGLADAIGHVAPCTGSMALLQLVPLIAFRHQPLPKVPLSVNQNDLESLIPRLPTPPTVGSTDSTEALKVIHQLLLASQLLGAFVESKLWWCLLKSCLDRCTDASAPASLSGYLSLLAGCISGASVDNLICPGSDEPPEKPVPCSDSSPSSSTQHASIIRQIINYLSSNDLLSVVSFAAKAALLECVLATVRRLEEAAVIQLTSTTAVDSVQFVDSDLDGRNCSLTAAGILLEDCEIRSGLFQILLALGAVWGDANSACTDFGSALVQLTTDTMRRLAKCERVCTGSNTLHPLVDPNEANSTHVTDPNVFTSNLLDPATPEDIDHLYLCYMLKLFRRLEDSQIESGSWHPKSVGLAIFYRCLQTAGPALLMTPQTCSASESCLPVVLRLLERGCRLDRVAGADLDKSPGGTDPLTMSSEAELRLRGLILLTRLTDTGSVRNVLASPTYLSHCLTHLVLPACVWRAGRTAEAMRKAAATCLVALIAAATSTYDLDEVNVDSRTIDEVRLDLCLCDHVETVRQLLGTKTIERDRAVIQGREQPPKTARTSSLPGLRASVLSVSLARFGGLLEDDLEATRRMACLNLTLMFNGLLLPQSVTDSTSFFSSSTWLCEGETVPKSVPESACPAPNSFGDQVYRFYPNLIKRLNDGKDQIRLMVTETFNAWLRLVFSVLVCPSAGRDPEKQPTLNTVHSAVVEDIIAGLMPHLDDNSVEIRAAVARVLMRLGRIAPDLVRAALLAASQRHRASELCNQLMQTMQLCDHHSTEQLS